jgi:hypothetical protein
MYEVSVHMKGGSVIKLTFDTRPDYPTTVKDLYTHPEVDLLEQDRVEAVVIKEIETTETTQHQIMRICEKYDDQNLGYGPTHSLIRGALAHQGNNAPTTEIGAHLAFLVAEGFLSCDKIGSLTCYKKKIHK